MTLDLSNYYRNYERHTETFEYLRLNAANPDQEVYYVLLHCQLLEVAYRRSLSITAIPLFKIDDHWLQAVHIQERTWKVEVDFFQEQVNLNAAGRIEIPHELRNRGLGSELLSNLIAWA